MTTLVNNATSKMTLMIESTPHKLLILDSTQLLIEELPGVLGLTPQSDR